MFQFIIKRLLTAVITLIGVLAIVFVVIRIVPGDPVRAMLGPSANSESVAAMRENLGLDRPIVSQFWTMATQAARGDFGQSLLTRRSVSSEIVRQFPYTFQLALASVVIAFVVGVAFGILSAVNKDRFIDHATRVLGLIGISIPVFYLGLLALLLFSVRLEWFPLVGGGTSGNPASVLHHLALPALTLGLVTSAVIMRMTRSCILEVLGEDYVRTARSKGLNGRVVLIRHGLRNALIPIITLIGLSLGQLMGGAVLTETVFSRPGLGQLLLGAIVSRDYPVLQGAVLVFAIAVVLANLLVDLSYGALDPRIRYG